MDVFLTILDVFLSVDKKSRCKNASNHFDKYTSSVFLPVVKMATSHFITFHQNQTKIIKLNHIIGTLKSISSCINILIYLLTYRDIYNSNARPKYLEKRNYLTQFYFFVKIPLTYLVRCLTVRLQRYYPSNFSSEATL